MAKLWRESGALTRGLPARSGVVVLPPWTVVLRPGRGAGRRHQRPSSRISSRTSSGPTCSPPATSVACSRRYP